ncbi:LamG domain-containing protein [Aeoliella mucimassa]|uniref:LamG-like jellyroll fold domain-containing protein n=1 Tax=Aeoliella mucimassa TaxID=2527972 RepID=A0A518AQX7_9BACT|nr:LamG domain-containing protein [Aeoliella mucimassa]QDU57115.1 hypothetical protein Pan181_33290 [Aeoliella mucimassa]
MSRHRLPHRIPLAFAILLGMLACGLLEECQGANVLLVMRDGSINASEQSRKTQFESWGHTVTTIDGNASQATFDTAMAAVDVVYISATTSEWEVLDKCKNTTAGVVNENPYLDQHLGYSSNQGWHDFFSHTEVTSNNHPITSGLSTGSLTIVSSTQQLAMRKNTLASGMTLLSQNSSYGNGKMLGVIEVGGALAGGGNAAGRRVAMPWGSDSFNWSSLNSNGLLIAERAIDWAASDYNKLILHWKFDETSGTSSADASDYHRNGTLSGSPTWITAKRDGGLKVPKGSYCYINSELGEPGSFTVAGWANVTASDTDGAAVLSIGNCVALLAHYSASNSPVITFWNGGSIEAVAASGGSRIGKGWHHYCATFNSSNRSLKIYVDGVLAGSGTTSGYPNYTVGNQTIAGDEGTPYYALYLTGSLDDIRVYNTAISASEVIDLYGLIGHWKFDEGTGTTIADSSPKANNATFSAGTPTWTPGVRDDSLQFSGLNTAATSTTFDPPPIGSVAFWFHPGSSPQWVERIFGVSDAWEARLESTAVLYLDIAIGGGTYVNRLFTNDKEWTHIVYRYDSTKGTYDIYLNGKLHQSGTLALSDVAAATLTMGTRTGSSERFSGGIDDLRVYSYIISEAEIAEIYGLVGHWQLDETSGSTAYDSSGIGNHGTYQGTVTVNTDQPYSGEYSAEFDGSSAYVSIPHHSSYNIEEAITIAAWTRADTYNHYNPVIAKGDSSWRLHQYLNSDYLTCHMDLQSGGMALANASSTMTGGWKHVVATYDGTIAKIYVNGELEGASSHTGLLRTNTVAVNIARNTEATSRLWDGGLADVRVYNRAISEQEVSRLYGLIGWWKLDESAGNTAYDSTPNARDGVIHGGPTLATSGIHADQPVMEFDGTDDFVQLPVIDDTFQTGVSLSVWARPTASPFYGKFIQLANGTWEEIDFGRFDTTDSLRMIAAPGMHSYQAGTIVNNAWHHYAGTIDRQGVIRLYVDGEQVRTDSRVLPTNVSRVYNFIGGSNWPSDGLYQGRMGDVRLYNRALSGEEVDAIYHSGKGPGIRLIKWTEAR